MNRTPLPDRIDVEVVRDLSKRRREARMTGVWLSIEDVESMLIEVEGFRNREDAASRRRRDASIAARRTQRKPTDTEVMTNLANQDPEDGVV